MAKNRYIQVILPLKLEWEPFYSLPEGMEVEVGSRVRVIFARAFYTGCVSRGDAEPEVDYSMLRLNLDLRLGIAYNWKNCFIGTQAQYNNFHYKNDHCKVNIYDAYARLAFGVRL